MGWKKRAIGIHYDSVSWHELMIGYRTKKTIDFLILSKDFNKCLQGKNHIIPLGEKNDYVTMNGVVKGWKQQCH